MRTIFSSSITFSDPDAFTSDLDEYRVVESAEAEDLEERIRGVLAEFTNTDYLLSHIDLAGGGDGHSFAVSMDFVKVEVPVIPSPGIAPAQTYVFTFLAADAIELTKARALAQKRVAALFQSLSSNPSFESLTLFQTLFSGACQGTHFMGALVFTANYSIG